MNRLLRWVVIFVVTAMALPSYAQLSGAIFTTDSTGSEVNVNNYASKDLVYLNGGPGLHAPASAAGLPPGVYYFQVTDPPGKTLLSLDPVSCRQFTVGSGGYMINVTPSGGCAHNTQPDIVNTPDGITVQLCNPTNCQNDFADTPNKGGVYKVWVTPVGSYSPGAGKFGFVPANSKTDNFKVKALTIREIDTRFHDTNNGGAYIDGMGITWIDTLGASNNKYSYLNTALDINHEAHVEGVEDGTHQIVIADQPGCIVDGNSVTVTGQNNTTLGPQTVSVPIKPSYKNITIFIDVNCN